MAAMTPLAGAVGLLLGGEQGLIIALVFAAGMNVFSWWNPERMVLRVQDARPVDASSAPELHRMTEDLARDRDRATERLRDGGNPENAAVAVTRMSTEEAAEIVAHECGHIRNRETLLMTAMATLAGAVSMLANFALFFGGRDRQAGLIGTLALMILAPLAAGGVQAAISRPREFEADRAGAEICGQPEWLASALGWFDGLARRIDNTRAERNPASVHLFIVNPLHLHAHDRLFAADPPTPGRVARLRAMGGRAPAPRASGAGGPWG